MKRLTLEEAVSCGRPVWLKFRLTPKYDGWGLFHSEHAPFLKFDMIGGARLMLRTDLYGDEWEAFPERM